MMDEKNQLRQWGYQQRRAQADKPRLSQIICQRFVELPEYQQAKTIMWYLHCRSEVQTREFITKQLHQNKRLVIPYCTENDGQKVLGLWHLTGLNELEPGMWGILEPPKARWQETEKTVNPGELDLIMVPGVVFDRQGGRLGNGVGYYDRLLAATRPDVQRGGVSFESQLTEKVPMEQHDIVMDKVVTETAIYSRKEKHAEY
jgi:5-formyltetrahydrofolate cyclo-ligase